MEVKNSLSGVRTVVRENAVTALQQSFLPRHSVRQSKEVGRERRVIRGQGAQRAHMATGDDEDVRWRLWVQVPKRDRVLTGSEELDSQFAARDAAEHAVAGRFTISCVPTRRGTIHGDPAPLLQRTR